MEPRLGTLERHLRVKPEPTSPPPNLKREQDEEEDQGPFQRRRKVKYIDLTGD